ncbi:AbiH family protein [Oenococcus oeni]
MVEVTYVIGNGFDLHLGLKTSYKDFYKYLDEQIEEGNFKDNGLIKDIEDSIKDIRFHGDPDRKEQLDPDKERPLVDWSNLEAGIAEDLKRLAKTEITHEEITTRIDNFFYELSKCLSRYLSSQNDLVHLNVSGNQAAEGILKPFRSLPSQYRDNLFNSIKKRNFGIADTTIKGRFEINFVNFNYTNTLDQYLSQIANVDNLDFKRVTYGSRIATVNKKILHPNGTFSETSIVGVGKEEDIPKELNLEDYQIEYLSKLDFARGRQDGRVEETFKRLKDSDVTVIYGMSIGESDAAYFDQIIEGMINNTHKYVIIIQFEKNYRPSLQGPIFSKRKRNIKKQLIDSYEIVHGNESPIEDKMKSQIRDRIFVEFDYEPSSYFPYEIKEKQENPEINRFAD